MEGVFGLGWGRGSMDGQQATTVGRRNLLRTLTTVGITTAAIAGSYRPAAAAETATTANRGKRQSHYQTNSAEVQTFYRVNSYPAH
jgi:nitrous oxide reductase